MPYKFTRKKIIIPVFKILSLFSMSIDPLYAGASTHGHTETLKTDLAGKQFLRISDATHTKLKDKERRFTEIAESLDTALQRVSLEAEDPELIEQLKRLIKEYRQLSSELDQESTMEEFYVADKQELKDKQLDPGPGFTQEEIDALISPTP